MPDVLASTANLLKTAGWKAGAPYSEGTENFLVALREWKSAPDSEIFGDGTMRDAPLAELASAVEWTGAPVAGLLNATVEVAGTLSNPLVKADIEALRGRFAEEPFDRVAAHVNYSERTLEATNAQIAAGGKQVQASASYNHAAGGCDAGLLRFEERLANLSHDGLGGIQVDRAGPQDAGQRFACK